MTKIVVEKSDAVRQVTLNRPEKRNALDEAMISGLREAFTGEPASTERVAVIRAEGDVFCAGLDLGERMGTLESASPIEDMLHAIETWPLPVVAVVQGHAIAGGNELALHCDFVVASTAAKFGMSLAQIGLVPTWFLIKKLMETAGPVATREILLLGDSLPAERMYELGLIARVAPPDGLAGTAAALIDRLSRNAPLSLRTMKALMVRQMAFRDDIPHAELDAQVVATRTSADAQEGLAAWREKRAPDFKGA